jgi:hypothetical protein
VSARTFETGVLYLVYRPTGSPPSGTYEDAKENLAAE